MKSFEKVFLLALFFTSMLTYAQTDNAASVSGADQKTEIRYYYFPNLQAYFDLQEKVYLYKEEGEWVEAEELPKNYGGYSLYNKVKVSITDYDGDEPYLMIEDHKKKFPYNSKGRFTAQTTASSE